MLDIFMYDLHFLYEISLILTALLHRKHLNVCVVERKTHFTYIVLSVNILA